MIRLSRWGVGALALALLATGAAAATFDARPYARVRDLAPPEVPVHPIAAVAFDDDLYEQTDLQFHDVRLVDDQDQEVPSLPRLRLVRDPPSSAEDTEDLIVVALKRADDGRLDIVVEKPKSVTEPLQAIELDTSLKDFEKRVDVEASEDQVNWTPVAEGATIYDYSRYVMLRQTRIELKPGAFLYYRLRISAADDEQVSPLRTILRDRRGSEVVGEQEHLTLARVEFCVDRVRGWVRRVLPGAQRVELEARRIVAPAATTDEENGDTLVSFELPNAALSRLSIESPNTNFVRPARLEGMAETGESGWTSIAEGTLVSIEVGRERRHELRLELPQPKRFSKYRLRIRNGDSPPIGISALVAETEQWNLLFFPTAERSYRLFYGRRNARRPDYDIGRVLAAAQPDGIDFYRLNPAAPNPAFKPIRQWGGGRAALIVAVLVGAVLLIMVIARTARAVECTPED